MGKLLGMALANLGAQHLEEESGLDRHHPLAALGAQAERESDPPDRAARAREALPARHLTAMCPDDIRRAGGRRAEDHLRVETDLDVSDRGSEIRARGGARGAGLLLGGGPPLHLGVACRGEVRPEDHHPEGGTGLRGRGPRRAGIGIASGRETCRHASGLENVKQTGIAIGGIGTGRATEILIAAMTGATTGMVTSRSIKIGEEVED